MDRLVKIINEEILGYATMDDLHNPNNLYKNPPSVKRFAMWVKAILDSEGNLYIEDKRGDWVHKDLAERLKQLGAIRYNGDFYDNIGNFVPLFKLGPNEAFALSDSAKKDMNTTKIIEKANQKHPQFKFFAKFYDEITKEDLNNKQDLEIN